MIIKTIIHFFFIFFIIFKSLFILIKTSNINKKNIIDLIQIESSFLYFNVNKINLLSLFIFSIILISNSFFMLDSSLAFCQDEDEEISELEEKNLITDNIRNSDELFEQRFIRSRVFLETFDEKVNRGALSNYNTFVFQRASLIEEYKKADPDGSDLVKRLDFDIKLLDGLVRNLYQTLNTQNENISSLKNLPMTPENCYIPKENYNTCCIDLYKDIINTRNFIKNTLSEPYYENLFRRVKILDSTTYWRDVLLIKNSAKEMNNNLEEIKKLKTNNHPEEHDPFFD